MAPKEGSAERRKDKRFRAQEGIFALLDSASPKLGPIVDISMGGLAFRYKGKDLPLTESSDLTLLFDDKRLNVYNMPLKFKTKPIAHVEIPDKKKSAFDSKMRCCVQFEELTYHQRLSLDNLILNQTDGEI
jgi:hypothetical protein